MGSVNQRGRRKGEIVRRKVETYAEHATHAEPLHLAEAAEGFVGDVLHERVQRALEERRGGRADLRVDADEVHEGLVNIGPDFCYPAKVIRQHV